MIERLDERAYARERFRYYATLQLGPGVAEMSTDGVFQSLLVFLERVPAIRKPIDCERGEHGQWSVKFALDIRHPLAWRVVQELGHVLNYLSVNERLPTVFMPVSPPPYMNGGPGDFLSWVIESHDPEFEPEAAARWLEGRLP